jgi:Rrf2 family nitric oxide-sensitive transcriptional repressor
MQLTRYCDYSLRVLIYLAVRPEYLATIEEISEAYGISRAHLTKVVHRLGRAGFVDTLRGRGGGIQLARAPEEIPIGGVVRRTEDKLAIVECLAPETSQCRIESACGLRGVLEEALDAFLETLDQYTLADVVARRRKPLARLLRMP